MLTEQASTKFTFLVSRSGLQALCYAIIFTWVWSMGVLMGVGKVPSTTTLGLDAGDDGRQQYEARCSLD